MRVLMLSNPPVVHSGYGNQIRLLIPHLLEDQHSMVMACNAGVMDFSFQAEGVLHLPPLGNLQHADLLSLHMQKQKCDFLWTLYDVWALDATSCAAQPWLAWTPVDSVPLRPENIEGLKRARWIWAMSRFGETELIQAGFGHKTQYVPLMINTDIFKPINRSEARAQLQKWTGATLGERQMVVAMVAMNKGVPSRKGFFEAMVTLKKIRERVPDAVLYLHTDRYGIRDGEDLDAVAEAVGLPAGAVLFPPQYEYAMAQLNDQYLNTVYNAADVYLQTSRGEGFGLPIVEAQAAGCPVVAGNYTSMSELMFWREGRVPAQMKMMFAPGTHHFVINTDAAAAAAITAHRYALTDTGRQVLAEAMQEYDHRTVYKTHIRPALAQIQAALENDKTETERREKMRLRYAENV